MSNTLSVVLKPNGQKIYGERPGVGSKKGDFPPGCRNLLCPADGRVEQDTKMLLHFLLFCYVVNTSALG
jgi:hypothetical protein